VTRPRAQLALAVVVLGAGGAGHAARAKAVDACGGGGPAPGPGALDPFRTPAAKALELNAAGKAPYRDGKWEEARARYRAALDADPAFLAPRLNIACSFVREERFADATREALALIDGAYVPWAREILEAADMGALKGRSEMKQIEAAMAAAATRWGEGLDESVLFVARQRAPLRVPDGPGVFLLNPQQEVWAYTPRTQRYRQLTVEDGHVVAFGRSLDRHSIVYVTAEKIVRGGKPDDFALRGVALRRLTLATMALGPRNAIDGDVRELDLYDRVLGAGRSRQTPVVPVRVRLATRETHLLWVAPDGSLAAPAGREGEPGNLAARLTAAGVEGPVTATLEGCGAVSATTEGAGQLPRLSFKPPGGKAVRLLTPFGAGLWGLPLP
jgi:hypothetical protein